MNFGTTLAQDPASGPTMRIGVVTQASPLLVRVGAATTPAPASALGSYAPRVDDVVTLLEQGADRIVLGTRGATLGADSFVPSWTNLSVGNGTTVGRFTIDPAGWCDFSIELTFGTTTSVSGDVRVALPGGLTPARRFTAAATYEDAGTRYYVGSAVNITAVGVLSLLHSESGNGGIVNATNPFTWAVNDDIWITGRFPLT